MTINTEEEYKAAKERLEELQNAIVPMNNNARAAINSERYSLSLGISAYQMEHQERFRKQFTFEDMEKAFKSGMENVRYYDGFGYEYDHNYLNFNEYIKEEYPNISF